MQIEARAGPAVAVRIAALKVCEFVQRRPLVVRAEEHFSGLGHDPSEGVRRLASGAEMFVDANPADVEAASL